MIYANPHHLSLQAIRTLYNSYLERYPDVIAQAESVIAHQLESGLAAASAADFKIVHPLLIQGWKSPGMKFRTDKLNLIGLDIETDHTTGEPKLLGLYYPEPVKQYSFRYNPTLETFFATVKNVCDNGIANGFVVWGRLDIQCLIRLFNPNESERKRISRGLPANVKNGRIVGSPPVMRKVAGYQFYISHYIPGRSLKLGYLDESTQRERTIWIFNLSQFYQNTIPTTAKGLGLKWQDFDRSTHLINWQKFVTSASYKHDCLASNKQDAVTVHLLADILQSRFHEVFECYPSLLVSTGSLTDAAVSKMLNGHGTDYESNSWKWLARNVWNDNSPEVIARAETLLAEAFSAGYVDQFAIGYFDKLHAADIAAAYPHKIRALHDLRHSVLLDGTTSLETDLDTARSLGYVIETVIIRGRVSIPAALKYHPITVKTATRENYRPTGEFYASYLLEEREFCIAHGATFSDEQYIIVGLSEVHDAPIAEVSRKLGEFRSAVLAEMNALHLREESLSPSGPVSDAYKVLDGRQYLIKVIDNSIYGKTVMTTEVVQDTDGGPVITGYIAGDRFNPLFGAMITARTRIQLADACMKIEANGGFPVMNMTDSVYWYGPETCLPPDVIRTVKTPGYFERPQSIHSAFILKTGQYEYCDDKTPAHWTYKLRGLPVAFDMLGGTESLYHRLISDTAASLPRYTPAEDVRIELDTRRLISIGSQDLAHLGMISEGKTTIRPFVMSGKQSERYVRHWRDCLTGAIWLTPLQSKLTDSSPVTQYPLAFLSTIYENHTAAWSADRREAIATLKVQNHRVSDDRKRLYIYVAMQRTNLPLPEGRAFRLTWPELEKYFGIPYVDILNEFKVPLTPAELIRQEQG